MSFDVDMIKSFIRSDLGCDCPEEVFDTIKYEHNSKLWHDRAIDHVLVVGDRLVVYICFVDDTKGFKSNFKKILGYGTKWRDDYGLNRFRLVIVTEKIKRFTVFIIDLLKLLSTQYPDTYRIHGMDCETRNMKIRLSCLLLHNRATSAEQQIYCGFRIADCRI